MLNKRAQLLCSTLFPLIFKDLNSVPQLPQSLTTANRRPLRGTTEKEGLRSAPGPVVPQQTAAGHELRTSVDCALTADC